MDGKKIGYIQLVSYLRGDCKPHIEYHIDEAYQGKGIMSRELPKYLKRCNKFDNHQLIAVVKKDNIPSIKLLEKNGFRQITQIDDKLSYIIDLRFTPEIVEKMIRKINIRFPDDNTINLERTITCEKEGF